MPTPPFPAAEDGYHHPTSEEQIIELVKYAAANGLQVRARGACHSVGWSIFTDPANGIPANQTLEVNPPPDDNINIALDNMVGLVWSGKEPGVVEVEAGCHLGHDTNDPFGKSTLETSFLYQAFQEGWGVSTLGGITHQTVSGFCATGSAGGSTRHAFTDMIAFRVVDGMGNAEWIEEADDRFQAMMTSVGLLGIVTKIRFKLIPMYNIRGTEITTPVEGEMTPFDMFGPGDADKKSLEAYFKQQDYVRVSWWTQPGIERIQTWSAAKVDRHDEDLSIYREFEDNFSGWSEQLAGSIMFVLLGNTTDLGTIFTLLRSKVSRYLLLLSRMNHRKNNGILKSSLVILGGLAVGALALLVGTVLALIEGSARKLFPKVLPAMQPEQKGNAMTPMFFDYYWRSLCMDNTADDVLMATEFTEIWIPIQYTQKVMNLLQDGFQLSKGSKSHQSLQSGWFEIEIYPGPPSKAWINPGYTDGNDEYAEGTVRLDIYWFRGNPDMPNTRHEFFAQFWEKLKSEKIPFRLHWGKYIPAYDLEEWAAYYKANLPRFQDFLDLRAQRDPHNVFFTQYWQSRLLGKPLDPAS